ncbi:MAG: pseudouridine synthase [Ghiorsea sp.]
MLNERFQYCPPPHEGLEILFQDEYFIACNKPSGLLAVPGRGEDRADSLSSRVQAEFSEALIVHRLDMPTSGIMLLARSKEAHRQMSMLFAERGVYKAYIAVVDGMVSEGGEVNQPLITDWENRPKQKIDHEHGKPSTTQYHVLSHDKIAQTSRIKLEPITGRSHQLRVHMQYLGHAIVGDEFYASPAAQQKATRLLLHAEQLTFIHPITSQPTQINCPAPF